MTSPLIGMYTEIVANLTKEKYAAKKSLLAEVSGDSSAVAQAGSERACVSRPMNNGPSKPCSRR